MSGQSMAARSGRWFSGNMRGWAAVFAFCALLIGGGFRPAMAASEGTLMGYWLSQDHDGVFLVQQCGDVVCGHLVGLQYEGTDVPRGHDGKVECNLMMLTDFRPMKENTRKLQGHILDPDTGHVYDAQIWRMGRMCSSSGVIWACRYSGRPRHGHAIQAPPWARCAKCPEAAAGALRCRRRHQIKPDKSAFYERRNVVHAQVSRFFPAIGPACGAGCQAGNGLHIQPCGAGLPGEV